MNKLFIIKISFLIVCMSLLYSCQQSPVKDNSNKEFPIITKQIKRNVFSDRCFREANWIHYVLYFDNDYVRSWGGIDTVTYFSLEKQVTSYLTDSYYVYEILCGYPNNEDRHIKYNDTYLTPCFNVMRGDGNKDVGHVLYNRRRYVFNHKLNEWLYIDKESADERMFIKTCSGITNLIENLSTTQKKEFDVREFTQRLKKARESIKGKIFDPVPSYFQVANDTLRIQGNVFLPE